MKKMIVGVDLAKKVIQVCVVQGNKVVSIFNNFNYKMLIFITLYFKYSDSTY